LPIQVAEGEILDNAIKADQLQSLANSEKRKIIKALLGPRFGLDDMPDQKPVEAADEVPPTSNIRETIAQQNDPNMPVIPPPDPGKPTAPKKPPAPTGQNQKPKPAKPTD
jgi:hypothetical protein